MSIGQAEGRPDRTLLARHADVLVAMDDARREIADGALFVRGNRIEAVGATGELPSTADVVLDLAGHVVLPGLVNTHHHMYQTLTRAVPDALTEDEAAILADARRAIEAFHDRARFAMVRVGIAPCSPFSVTESLMREAAALARSYGVGLHTHLAESARDVAYSREKYGRTPAEYAEALGWTGRDVWHAHCVQLDAPAIALFARTGTGVARIRASSRLASEAAV